MNRHLPPLTCLSYMSSSTLKLCRQPLCGGGILERCYEMRKSSRVAATKKKREELLLCLVVWQRVEGSRDVVLYPARPLALHVCREPHCLEAKVRTYLSIRR